MTNTTHMAQSVHAHSSHPGNDETTGLASARQAVNAPTPGETRALSFVEPTEAVVTGATIKNGSLFTVQGMRIMKNGRVVTQCKPGLETVFVAKIGKSP